ncbi:MAG TPA: alpha-amylase family glycosyl hydrolase [Cytophagales bacterium]|jgi:1,4-alpha-glucan branching enzyme
MINLSQLGAIPQRVSGGGWQVQFGMFLPGITFPKGYRLKVRIIHDFDQFIRGIEPADFWMNWVAPDRWETTVPLTPDPQSHFGQEGRYLYRYQLLRGDQEVTFWFSDPFGRESGLGTLSAFTINSAAAPFPWTDAAFTVPEVDRMVVYELNVREFNRDFDGVIAQLDYLWDLGVNVLELMPVSNVKEEVEWGYTPLGYFAPDERLGGREGLKRLVNACHARGIAVILDSVYAHAHPEFAYNLVYNTTGEPNPMMGPFAGEFFSNPGTDYSKAFTRDYFLALSQYLLDEYHVDGFRYDYVPGMYDGPAGQGYAKLVFDTYNHSKGIPRFAAGGRSRLIQCAEHLPDPAGVLSQTYTNCAWQNGLMDHARGMARGGPVTERLAHLLDPQFIGYPAEYRNDAAGDVFPVAPFQYLETHDHKRFINELGELGQFDLLGMRYGDRSQFYRVQPFIIALYTGKGIPMLWNGQEFGENWGVPDGGIGRVFFERPLHWEYFYDAAGRALVRLHRIMGNLRRTHRALDSRGYFYYYQHDDHLRDGVIVYRRRADATATAPAENILVALNFSGADRSVWLPFEGPGTWREAIDGKQPAVQINRPGDWAQVTLPSNYGAVYVLG